MAYYPSICNRNAFNPDYLTNKARLETFGSDDEINKRLARCGFYATGSYDCVKCFYCGVCYRDLPTDENLWFHHATDSPDCEFLKLHKGEKFIEKARYLAGQDPTELDDEKDLECNDSDQMIEDLNSRASQMMMDQGYKQSDVEQAIIKAREIHGYGELKSTQIFEWLLENESINKPSKVFSTAPSTTTYHESPATSGFSKIMDTTDLKDPGTYDCVKCFFCGICFRDLPPDQNIWFHHATDSPDCEFLKLHKGEKFIEKALYLAERDPTELDDEKDLECNDSDQMIEDLNSRASQMMMDKGYKQSDVEQAIIKAREKHGYGELKVTEIFEWLLENESINKPSKVFSTAPSTATYHESPATSFSGFSKFMDTSLDPEHRHLIEENRTLKSKMTCKICMDKESCVLFQPCGHMVSCMSCASRLKTCAVCRATVTQTVRTYTG